MKWRVRKPGARCRAKHRWHKWFAWRPVRIPTQGRMSNMTRVWLESIERKGKLHGGYEPFWKWQYRFLQTNHKK